MKVATWNVNSILVRLPHVIDWLKTNQPDVLCMQELKVADDRFPHQAFSEIGYNCLVHGEKTYNGVAVVIKSEMAHQALRNQFDEGLESHQSRFIEVQAGPIYVINCYVPNGQEVGSEKYFFKLRWLGALKMHLAKYRLSSEDYVVCGDFNIAPEDADVYDPVALADQILVSKPERDALIEIVDLGLVDTFRMHNKDANQFSWWDYRMAAFRRNMGLRIDFVLASKALAGKCRASWIDKAPRKLERPSDHAPVVAEFQL